MDDEVSTESRISNSELWKEGRNTYIQGKRSDVPTVCIQSKGGVCKTSKLLSYDKQYINFITNQHHYVFWMKHIKQKQWKNFL